MAFSKVRTDLGLAILLLSLTVDLTTLIPSQPSLRVRRRRILRSLSVRSFLRRDPHPRVSDSSSCPLGVIVAAQL